MPKKSEVSVLREYIKKRHKELFRIDYVTNNHAAEGGMMKRLIDEHGYEVVKRFIDACMYDYMPTKSYPGINFAFMYSYMRGRILPRVLAEVKKERERAEREPVQQLSDEELADWL